MKLSWFSCPVAWLYVFVAVTCPVALACLVVSCLLAYLSSSSLAESSKPVKPYMELARTTLPPLVRLARPLLDESFADFRTGTLLAEALSG